MNFRKMLEAIDEIVARYYPPVAAVETTEAVRSEEGSYVSPEQGY